MFAKFVKILVLVNDRILTNGNRPYLYTKAQDFVLQQKQSPTRNRFYSSTLGLDLNKII